MIFNKKEEKSNRVPIHFADEEDPKPKKRKARENDPSEEVAAAEETNHEPMESAENESTDAVESPQNDVADVQKDESIEPEAAQDLTATDSAAGSEDAEEGTSDTVEDSVDDAAASQATKNQAGPLMAELVATRSELRRVETERNDLLERLARRQADFENYRKRVDRERGETYQRLVGDVVSKLLPVMDNMRRALEAESLLEKNESAEFRHFLRGVELIYKQLNVALEEYGVEPVLSVGQPFDPHLHEAVATEHSDEYEPDTVTQELLRGYRLGDKLLRPAMVKVSTRH